MKKGKYLSYLCWIYKETFFRLFVVAGSHAFSVLEENIQIARVCSIKIHHDYQNYDVLKRKETNITQKTTMNSLINRASESNDIALLELCQPISLNSYIKAIRLAPKNIWNNIGIVVVYYFEFTLWTVNRLDLV